MAIMLVKSLIKLSSQSGGNFIKLSACTFSTTTPNGGLADKVERAFYNYYPSVLIRDKWSKLISIEGNIGVGKECFSKSLSERFDLRHLPTADPNYIFTRMNTDFKELSDEEAEFKLHPDSVSQRSQGYSMDYFCQNPDDWEHTARVRYRQLKTRSYQLNDATGHLLHTGQGVSMVRHFYSDVVLAEAQRKMGWFYDRPEMPEETGMASQYYDIMCWKFNQYFLAPHIIFYIDMSAEDAYKKVQEESCNEYEKLLPLQYFKYIEESYEEYLEDAEKQGVNVIKINPKLPFDQVSFDLEMVESFDVPFSAWVDSPVLDANLRKIKKKCYNYWYRVFLTETHYTPVDCTWYPRFGSLQENEEFERMQFYARGFNPKKDMLYLFRSGRTSSFF